MKIEFSESLNIEHPFFKNDFQTTILQKFNILQFEIQPKNKKVIFEEIDVSYQDAVNDLELMLQNIYLQGNNLTLKRVRE